MIGDLGKAVLGITKAYQLGKVLKSGFSGTKKGLEKYKGSKNKPQSLKPLKSANQVKQKQLQQLKVENQQKKIANQEQKANLTRAKLESQALKMQNQQMKLNEKLSKQRETAEKLKKMGFGPNPSSAPKKRPTRVAGGNIRAKKYGNRYNY